MKKKVLLILLVVGLIIFGIGAGIVQAQPGQANLAPGKWYTTTMNYENYWESWDNPSVNDSSSFTLPLTYKREGEFLFIYPDLQSYSHADFMPEGQYIRWFAVDEVSGFSGVEKRVATSPYTITITEDGITLTRHYDVYKLIESSPGSGIYHWQGESHYVQTGTAPLGKPVNP